MNYLKLTLLAGGAITALVAIAALVTQTSVSAVPPPPTTDVVVTNTPLPITTNTSLPVTPHHTPFREPFATVAMVNLGDTQNQLAANFGTPMPPGRRFVIQYASALSFVQAGQKYRLILFAGGVQFHLSGDLAGTDVTQDVYTLNEPVSASSHPAEILRVNMTRFNGTSGTAQTQITLSGYLIDG